MHEWNRCEMYLHDAAKNNTHKKGKRLFLLVKLKIDLQERKVKIMLWK